MVSDKTACRHCGVRFYTLKADNAFCCKGCAHVYQLIQAQGLEHFYDLRSEKLRPVRDAPFVLQDLGWLTDLVTKAEYKASPPEPVHVTLWTQSRLSKSISWLIKEHFSRQHGSIKLHIDEEEGMLELFWRPNDFDAMAFAQKLQNYGVLLFQEPQTVSSDLQSLSLRLGFCSAFTLGVVLFSVPRYFGIEGNFGLSGLFSLLTVLLATLAYALGISYFTRPLFKAISRGRWHPYLVVVVLLTTALIGSYVGWFTGISWLIGFDVTAIMVCGALLAARWFK